jgi:hypothetical protein
MLAYNAFFDASLFYTFDPLLFFFRLVLPLPPFSEEDFFCNFLFNYQKKALAPSFEKNKKPLNTNCNHNNECCSNVVMVMLFLPSVGILEMFESELHTLQLKVFFSLFLYQKSWQFFLKKQKKIEFTLEKYEI